MFRYFQIVIDSHYDIICAFQVPLFKFVFLTPRNLNVSIAGATPKQIRELMNVDDLTNDEVKSHLQVTLCVSLDFVCSEIRN